MKKGFIAAAVLAVFEILPAAASENVSFKLETGLKLKNGILSEYVFAPNCKNTNNKVSQLDWDIQNIPVYNWSLTCNFLKYNFITLSLDTGIPKSSGSMQDYDWLNSMTYKWQDDDPTELTNYSKHENKLDVFYDLNLTCGRKFYVKPVLAISPLCSFELMYMSMTAINGYSTYKSYNWEEKTFTGQVINYSQLYLLPNIGCFLEYGISKKLYIHDTINFCPALCFNTAIDKHFQKSTAYLDKIYYSWKISYSSDFEYSLSSAFSIKLGFELQYFPLASGKDYNCGYRNNSYTTKWKRDSVLALGGSELFTGSIFLSYCIRF